MKRRYVYDKDSGEFIEITPNADRGGRSSPLVFGDIAEFVSPIDGSLISSRSRLREYMRAKQLVHADDFRDTWAKAAKERELRRRGQHPEQKRARIQALRDAYERVRNESIARGTWRR